MTVRETDESIPHITFSILVAEDNVINRLFVKAVLQKLGYTADFVENGREAVGALQQKVYDLVLMDVQMPVMDGFEAVQEIRKMDIHQPYIVALTANVTTEDQNNALKVGMDDFFCKPFVLAQLKQLMERITQKSPSN